MFVTVLPTLSIWLTPMLLWVSEDGLFRFRMVTLFYGLAHLYFGRLPKPADRFSSALIAVLPLLSYFAVIFASADDALIPKAGLYIKISITPGYSDSCRPTKFVLPTGPQEIGRCPGGVFGDPADPFTILIYDTSGEIAWPPATRTQAWKDAVLHLTEPWSGSEQEVRTYAEALTNNPRRVSHLWGPYYAVVMGPGELS
jgi:hypothetical protein